MCSSKSNAFNGGSSTSSPVLLLTQLIKFAITLKSLCFSSLLGPYPQARLYSSSSKKVCLESPIFIFYRFSIRSIGASSFSRILGCIVRRYRIVYGILVRILSLTFVQNLGLMFLFKLIGSTSQIFHPKAKPLVSLFEVMLIYFLLPKPVANSQFFPITQSLRILHNSESRNPHPDLQRYLLQILPFGLSTILFRNSRN
ncbi:hypothetical protein LEP1GSC193_0773 [Leptospira phage vB_LalZ_80412-LE1]|uniref:Uncharacterized protein n=1 Tax=Leptospira alstonii serovar Sichuan str. 79601 TaxID=1218565 RepID=M6DAG0_9LEPT|nr:hypothetical protein LEP1GSC193_0773 [Leptospira phage vB_LalZ_80412-LE1]EMJ95500.1 hypothetical protein LEP1GSC194_3573 [Leptospira alstonii serovar Sichuan str. 79601]